VVLELESAVVAKVFALSAPPRVVIDISGKRRPLSSSSPALSTGGKVVAVNPKAAGERTDRKPTVGSGGRKVRIVIDPGHGGRDPGANGYRGMTEKQTVFDISRRLAGKLRARPRTEVLLTRTGDRFLSLAERKDLANRWGADLFISVHVNASDNKRLRGIETYYLKNSDDRATRRLAMLENGVDTLMGDQDVSTDADLPYILSDMVQGYKEAESMALAKSIQNELVAYLGSRYEAVENLGVKQGPFLVLDGTHMTSVLVEAGFITHGLEGRRLSSASYREAAAEGMYRGIKHYLEKQLAALN
jgi:N-acetylmuramoyl-L-alanine amidase